MMPIIQTKEVKAKKESLLNDVNTLRENGVSEENIIDELDRQYGWNIPEFMKLFSSTMELCDFIKLDENDYKDMKWRN